MGILNVSARNLRPKLASVLKDIDKHFNRYIITRNGKPVGILMSVDDYEGILETMDIEKDKALMRRIERAEQDKKRGKGRLLEIIHRELGLV